MPVLPSAPRSLVTHVAALLADPDSPQPRSEWLRVLEVVAEGLNNSPRAVEPFVLAWGRLFTLTTLLDHLQDGDDLAPLWFAQLPSALQYQLLFGAYVLQQHAVLGPYTHVPTHRVACLQDFWASCVALIAEGQYRDLTASVDAPHAAGSSTLDTYEALIALKAGTLFELGFGGVAMLCTDHQPHIGAARDAGKIFGMLLQYGDDLLDSQAQQRQPTALTLPRALERFQLADTPIGSTEEIWASLATAYVRALSVVLTPLPPRVQTAIQDLVAATFGVRAARPPAAVEARGEVVDEP